LRWLERLRQQRSAKDEESDPWHGNPRPVDRAAPGIAALFHDVPRGEDHAILDLGHATESHLSLFGRYSRRVRFAGLLPRPPVAEGWAEAVDSLPADPARPYDLVLAWDLLDRVGPEARPRLIRRLAELTAPGARLYLVVDQSGDPAIEMWRFTLLDLDHVRQQVVGPPLPSYGHLLPAQLERLLRPFEIERAYALRGGQREYVAVRGPDNEVMGRANSAARTGA
jgi:hypothetical protein